MLLNGSVLELSKKTASSQLCENKDDTKEYYRPRYVEILI